MASVTTARVAHPARLGIHYKLLIIAYVVAVILFNTEGGWLLVVPKVIAPLIALAFVVLVLGQGRKIYVPTTYAIWALWLLVAITSTLLAEDVNLGRIITLVQLSGVGIMITNFLIWNRDTSFYVLAFVGGVAASSFWIGTNPEAFIVNGRMSGTIGNANAHGVLLSVGMIFSVVMAFGGRNWMAKTVLFLFSFWFFIQILQTGSRQAMLGGIIIGGGAVGAAYLYNSWCARDGSFVRAVLVIFTTAPAVVIALITSDFWSRMESGAGALQVDATADGSVTERMWMIRRGLELWAEQPILGIGLDNFRHSAQADHFFAGTIGTYAHNNYIELVVTTGLVGFLSYVFIYFLWLFRLFVLRAALKHRETWIPFSLVLSTFFVLVATDMTRVSYYEKLFWLLLPWIVAELHLLETKVRVVRGGSQAGQGAGAHGFAARERRN